MTEAGPEMLRRVAAAQATLDEFKGRQLKLGQVDCVRMIASHLRRLGYRVRLPAKGSYASPKSARKALLARGFDTLADALDAVGLERIAPAAAIVGDVVMKPSDDGLGSLMAMLGNGRALGWHVLAREHGALVLQPIDLAAAWRATPKG